VRRPGVSLSLPSVPGVARSELSSSAVEAFAAVDVAGATESGVANGLGVVELELPNPN
jgi:hypothetical protein